MPNILGRKLSREESLRHVGHMDQLAGVRAGEAADGMGRGLRTYQFYTGSGLAFDVLADPRTGHRRLPLAWASPVAYAPTY